MSYAQIRQLMFTVILYVHLMRAIPRPETQGKRIKF